jgi:putative FmdB family regulatory protein
LFRVYIVDRVIAGGCTMPIYEYECLDCGKTFETFQKISDNPLTECRVCSGRLNRLISNCSFQLKGTGWYVTDYKSSSSGSSGKGNGSAQAKSDAKSETTAETKSETKAETTSTMKSEATT